MLGKNEVEFGVVKKTMKKNYFITGVLTQISFDDSSHKSS
jgi:hypothetical protein